MQIAVVQKSWLYCKWGSESTKERNSARLVDNLMECENMLAMAQVIKADGVIGQIQGHPAMQIDRLIDR